MSIAASFRHLNAMAGIGRNQTSGDSATRGVERHEDRRFAEAASEVHDSEKAA